MKNNFRIFVFLLGLLASTFRLVKAEQVQYCKFGSYENPDAEIDFCTGTATHLNASTNDWDIYVTFTVTRWKGSALGWTAIGPGNNMEDALMFIVYGDPTSYEDPIISIRRAAGHTQPRVVTESNTGMADIRVLRSSWLPLLETFTPDNFTYVAVVSLVCYACHLWPGIAINPRSRTQPWVWAWNNKQEFPVYSYDAHLQMHRHHAGAGGWGNFYTDFARSINTGHLPSVPAIQPHIAAIGASDTPGGHKALTGLILSPSLHLHAICMATAFLFLFPFGTIAMRSTCSHAFKYHWIVQLSASVLTILGLATGLALRSKLDSLHQGVGIVIVILIGVQGILGWRHHVVFMELSRRTWLSHSHIWLGKLVMCAGWANLAGGMVMGGHRLSYVASIAAVSATEALGLVLWLWWRKRRQALQEDSQDLNARMKRHSVTRGMERYFALTDGEDEDPFESEQKEHIKKDTQG